MTTKTIKRGQAGFVLETERPDGWPSGTTVTVDIINLDGLTLVDDAAVTVYAGDTFASDVEAGEFGATLVSGNAINAGQNIKIGDDAQGYQTVTVTDFDSFTNTILFEPSARKDFNSGTTVAGCSMIAIIDASLSGFDGVQEVQVHWKPDGNALTMTEIWRVLNTEHQLSGLATKFRDSYPSCFDSVGSDGVDGLYRRAENYIGQYFKVRSRDIKKIMDNELLEEAIMAQMALMVGTGGDLGEQQFLRVREKYDNLIDVLNDLPIWIDSNEDNIQDDSEVQSAPSTVISRGL